MRGAGNGVNREKKAAFLGLVEIRKKMSHLPTWMPPESLKNPSRGLQSPHISP